MEIDEDDLIALVRNYNPNTNEAKIRAAYAYGADMHDGQFRHSGEQPPRRASVVQRKIGTSRPHPREHTAPCGGGVRCL